MAANIHPSRIKAGLMTLTGTTSDGSTNILKLVNHTGSTLVQFNTLGSMTGKTITLSSLPAKTSETDIIYIDSNGMFSCGALPTISNSSINITKLVNQTSHGFNVNDVIGWSGTSYNKAIADGTYGGEILGVVSRCYNANCFDLTQAGYVTGLTSLSQNTTYFLSDETYGLLTSTEPTGDTHISKSMLLADSSTSGWVLPYVGYVVTTGDTTGVVWGNITGSIINQVDLQQALDDKLNVSVFEAYTATTSSLLIYTISGNSTATGFTVQHDLNQQYVVVEITQTVSPYSTVFTEVQRPNANCVRVLFDDAPPTGTNYNVLITG
jgi:hypothetical protein